MRSKSGEVLVFFAASLSPILSFPLPGNGAGASTNRAPAAYTVPEITVTASSMPSRLLQPGRPFVALSRRDMDAIGAGSVPGALDALSSVSASERGGGDVQADLSIRGATFQQVLVTLDGMPFADPQTAHHNMDLPLPLVAVDRLTVVPGAGTALYGPSAFGGVVDVASHVPTETGAHADVALGSFGTRRMEGLADFSGIRTPVSVAGSYADSDGFEEGTDYRVWSLWGSSIADYRDRYVRVSGGYTDKNYGARDFYAPYPSEEHTVASLADVSGAADLGRGWLLKGTARLRRHVDEFTLSRENPSLYRNRHVALTYSERVTVISPDSAWGGAAVGVERSDASLDSSRIGDRDSSLTSLLGVYALRRGDWNANAGARVDRYDPFGYQVAPSAGVTWQPGSGMALHATAAKAARPPSFTELYYSDPLNQGNPDLDPEEAWEFEAGAEVRPRGLPGVSACWFRRTAWNLIDWVRSSRSEPWVATNIGEGRTEGGELAVFGAWPALRWRLDYRYAGLAADAGDVESKYALNVPRHDAGVSLTSGTWRGFAGSVALRYRDVPTLDRFCLVSAKVSKMLGRFTVHVLGRNLLDQRYEEIPGVATSGAYMECGVDVAW